MSTPSTRIAPTMRIDTTTDTSADMRPEWHGPAFMGGRVFVADLGCLDATDAMPGGSVRQWRPSQPAQSLWLRGYQ